MVIEVTRGLRPVFMRRFVEVAANDNGISRCFVFLGLLYKAADGIVTLRLDIALEHFFNGTGNGYLAKRTAIVAPHIVVGIIEIIEMGSIDRHFFALGITEQTVDRTVVVVFRKNGEGIGDGVTAEQSGVLTFETVIGQSALKQRLGQPPGEVGVMIIAHFAERDEIGFKTNNLLYDSIIAALNLRAFLPDIPLQNRKFFGPCGRRHKPCASCKRHQREGLRSEKRKNLCQHFLIGIL